MSRLVCHTGAGRAIASLAAVLTLILTLGALSAAATTRAAGHDEFRSPATYHPSRQTGSAPWQAKIGTAAPLAYTEITTGTQRRRASQRVDVQVSSDGRRYRTVRTVRLKPGERRRVGLGGRRASHVRLRARSPWGVWLSEVRIFWQRLSGPAAPVPVPVPVPVPPIPSTNGSPTVPPAGDPRPPTAHDPTGPAPAPTPLRGNFAGVVTTPTDARFLTRVPFGDRSHWLQPWRAFLDTPPVSKLRSAVGINFNVVTRDAQPVARLLAANGFRRARIEIAWGELDDANPRTLWRAAEWRTKIRALRDAGLRPLVLLNSDDGRPTALRDETLRTTSAIPAGTKTVQLDAASAAKVVPGRTGFNNGHVRADVLITSLSGTTATLSKGVPRYSPAGEYPASTLQYEPFSPLTKADGSTNPVGEATMRGWLDYVETVTAFVRSELGSSAFDVEISNEANLNAAFYDINRYYEPDRFPGRVAERSIVRRTVDWLRDPAHALPHVRVTNGFASQRPWDSAATSPAGLDALSKHYYPRYLRFPSYVLQGNRPIDAVGNVAGWHHGIGWSDSHNPQYDTFFPEFSLTAIATESIVRDTAPLTTRFVDLTGRHTDHGRHVTNPVGKPVEFWMTEIGLETAAGKTLTALSPADEERLRAKSTLRTLTSYVNKGVTQIDLFSAGMAEWTLIGSSFWERWITTGTYPGDTAGGPTLDGVRRLTAALGADAPTVPRKLTLASIGDYGGRIQFHGDGSIERPALHDREVLAFLPFQASDTRFVVPVYVMTRNMAKVQRPGAPTSDPTRLDLPAERYQLTIGGTDARNARVTASDPLTGENVPVDVVRRTDSGWLVVELPVTDSPRLLVIDDR